MYILKQVGGMFKKNMRNISRVILGVLIVLSVASFAMIYRARSVVAGPGEPFGGLVLSITPCTCSSGVAVYFNDLTVSPPITLPLIYQPGVTITYEMYNQTTPGAWILGTWQPGGTCRVWVGKFCTAVPTAGTMYMVGSSGI